MKHSRREFMVVSAGAISGAAVARAAEPALRFPLRARERLAVASYSFRSLMDTPRNRTRVPAADLIALKDFASVITRRYDVHGVELLGQHFPSREPAYLLALRDAVKSAGSHIVNIPASVGGSVYDADESRRALAVENAKKWVDTAVAVDCPGIRVHLQGAVPDVNGPAATLAARSLRSIAEYGEVKGVVINLENDDPATEDAMFIAKVIDQANHPWLRALPDFCNSMLQGDEASNYDAVTAMFRRAYNICHVKDSEVDGGKTVRIDLGRTFQIAKQNGYKGYFSIEWEGAGDVWVENGKLIEQSLKYLGEELK
jgi:sugar phosphate isomerase/epimerase